MKNWLWCQQIISITVDASARPLISVAGDDLTGAGCWLSYVVLLPSQSVILFFFGNTKRNKQAVAVRNALSHASMIANRFDINRDWAALAFINISDLNRRNYSHKAQHRIRQQTILGSSATGLKTSSEK